MKILYAVHGYKPAYKIGGPIHSVSALAERLAHRGYDMTVFTTNSNLDEDLNVPINQPLNVEGVQVWYFQHQDPVKKYLPFIPYFSKSIGFLYAPQMKRELDRIMPSVDLVHVHLPFVYPTLAAGKLAIRCKKPLFYHQRGVFDHARLKFRGVKKKIYISAVERSIMRRATMLIALTEAEVESYRALGIKTPCRVIPNGVDLPDPEDTDASALSPFQFSDDEIVVLFLARLHPIKGADRLIQAFLATHKYFPKARLVMAGPDEWGIAEQYRQEIAAAGASNQVLFPGVMIGKEKQQLLSRADLFCLPSDGEGFSVAILEAFANYTAALLSPGCHFPEAELVGAARICDPRPDSLAKEMACLLREPSRLREMGRKGRALVEQHYSWDTIADQIEAAYLEGTERLGPRLR